MAKEEFIVIEVERKCMSWRNTFRISPHPKYFNLLIAHTQAEERKKIGDTVNQIIKEYYDRMPPDQRSHLLNKSKNHY